jgi:inorganic pyrophosphatase
MSTLKNEFDMIVEIPKGSNIKYEWNEEHSQLIVDRIIQTPVNYFFNYGFLPNTLGKDGDPLDVVLLNIDPVYPLSRIRIKVLGMLETRDEHGEDNKIIAVPSDRVDPKSSCLHDLGDVCHHLKSQIVHFFSHYKDLEANKWIEVGEFQSLEKTLTHIRESHLNKNDSHA